MARRKRNYTVRTGDTAATIAKQLGIDPQTLMRANTGASMRPGEVLGVPRAGAVAYTPPNIPYPPSELYPPATQPIPAYTQIAGHGTPTDYSQFYFGAPAAQPQEGAYPPAPGMPDFNTYDNVTEAERAANNIPVGTMVAHGYINRGGVWIRPAAATETPSETGDKGAGDISLEQYRTALDYSTPGAYKEFAEDRLGGRNLAFDRIGGAAGDGGYNLITRRGPTGNITTTPVSGATARSMSRPKSLGRRQARMRYVKSGGDSGWNTRDYNRRRTDDTQSTSGRPVGTAARYQQQYSGYGSGGSYMPSVRQFARPNYLGLINWRI